jgi:hypothetical protein
VRCDHASVVGIFLFIATGCGDPSRLAPTDASIDSAAKSVNDPLEAGALEERSVPDACEPVAPSAITCHTQGLGRLRCDTSKVSAVPWGAPVTVAGGEGGLPTPAGGPLVDGSYVLVAETLYESPPPDVAMAHVGDQVREVLSLQCDIFNELYFVNGVQFMSGTPGNTCGQLTFPADSDAAAGGTSYTSTGDMLYLITPYSYDDLGRGISLGTYEVVDAFQRLPLGARGPSMPCVPPGSDTSRALAPGMRDPGCPSSPPPPGTPCNPQPPPLECEYGGDAWGRCTTFAACAEQPGGGFAFQFDPQSACSPNPTSCPSTFSDGLALAGSATVMDADGGCPGPSIVCSYPEGVCGCLPRLSGCQWNCRSRTSVAPCPAVRPLAGDPCFNEGEQCPYGDPCQYELSLGPSMTCQHGNWIEVGGNTSCPLMFGCPLRGADGG